MSPPNLGAGGGAQNLSKPNTLPSRDEIEAMAMLLGELTMICSCCLGHGASRGIFGGKRRCGQCNGVGYDYLGEKTADALGLTNRQAGGYMSKARVYR